MKIELFHNIDPKKWNNLCDNSDYAWLFHRYEWIEIESQFFTEKNLSFGIVKNNQLIALQPLYKRRINLGYFTEILIDSGIHRHTGLAFCNNLNLSEIKAIRAISMNYIFHLAEEHDVDRIQLNTHNLAPINLSSNREEIPFWVRDYGFYLGLNFSKAGFVPIPGMSTCNADQIVDLKNDESSLFSSLEEACRRAIRKAEKNKLLFTIDNESNVIDEYYKLAIISAQKTGEILPPKEFYLKIYNKFYPSERCKILFALHNNKKIGALFLLIYKKAVNFMAGISHPEYLILRVNDFLHWSAIKWAKKRGYLYYRLGPVFPEVPKDWPIYKVSRFKKKFGGKYLPIIQGSYFRKPYKYLDIGINELKIRCALKVKNLQ